MVKIPFVSRMSTIVVSSYSVELKSEPALNVMLLTLTYVSPSAVTAVVKAAMVFDPQPNPSQYAVMSARAGNPNAARARTATRNLFIIIKIPPWDTRHPCQGAHTTTPLVLIYYFFVL